MTMNNVQWAGMRLFDDAGMGCGAWDQSVEKTIGVFHTLIIVWIANLVPLYKTTRSFIAIEGTTFRSF